MRVALFTDTFSPQVNGVTTTLNQLVQYWERAGIDFLVFAPRSEEQSPDSDCIRRVPSFPLPLYPECRVPLSRFRKIERQLQEFVPDIIHLVTPFTLGLVGRNLGLKYSIPLVASYHTNFDQYLDYYHLAIFKKMSWAYIAWFHGVCERNFCPSSATKKVLEKYGIGDLEVWSRGIDTSQYSPDFRSLRIRQTYGISKTKLLLLYVGRVAAEKDLDILLESYRSLPADVAEKVHLIVAGDGPFKLKVNLRDYPGVTWTGYLHGRELVEAYASCDLFVFPSSTETFGNVVLEAMASGLPVVAVRAGGVVDIVSDMKTGVLCQARSIESFRDGISFLVNNGELRRQMADLARAEAIKQNWDSIFDGLMESYQTVISKERPIERNLYRIK
ncbi:MAG: glycosyltransferase family 4 protein [Desulfitobacteriaceae bacterium]